MEVSCERHAPAALIKGNTYESYFNQSCIFFEDVLPQNILRSYVNTAAMFLVSLTPW